MPKGRGANERRRNHRQKHPKEKDLSGGHAKLMALISRARKVANDRRGANPHHKRVIALKQAHLNNQRAKKKARKEWTL